MASQFHDPPGIEPFSSALIGAERRILLDKKGGIDRIRINLAELGRQAPADARADLLQRIKDHGTRNHGLVPAEDFQAMLEEVAA